MTEPLTQHTHIHLCAVKSDTGFPGGSIVKTLPAKAGDSGEVGLIPAWVREIPWRKK